MADRRTMEAYAKGAADYSKKFGAEHPDSYLARFIAALDDGARVLDLGCGPGRSSVFMQAAGLAVESWDASADMAEVGRKTFGIDIRIAEFDQLDAPARYDGIYANFSLLHAPKAEMPDHLARVSRALRPGGLFHIGLKTGTGEARDKLGRFYAYYSDAEITGLLEAAGFAVETRDFGADEGLDGTVAPWIILTARKQEP